MRVIFCGVVRNSEEHTMSKSAYPILLYVLGFARSQYQLKIIGPVQPDGNIKALNSENCANSHSKQGGIVRIRQQKCSFESNKWVFDEKTGQIKQDNSCWRIKRLKQESHQKVIMKACDSKDPNQQFDWVNGRIFSKSSRNICVEFDTKRRVPALTASRCFHNTFFKLRLGNYGEVTPESAFDRADDTLRPLGTSYCIELENDEIIFNNCDQESSFQIAKSSVYKASQAWNFEKVGLDNFGLVRNSLNKCWAFYPSGSVTSFRESVLVTECNASDENQYWVYKNSTLATTSQPIGLISWYKNQVYCAGLDVDDFGAPGGKLQLGHCYFNLFGELQVKNNHELTEIPETSQVPVTVKVPETTEMPETTQFSTNTPESTKTLETSKIQETTFFESHSDAQTVFLNLSSVPGHFIFFDKLTLCRPVHHCESTTNIEEPTTESTTQPTTKRELPCDTNPCSGVNECHSLCDTDSVECVNSNDLTAFTSDL